MQDVPESFGLCSQMAIMGEDYWQDCLTSETSVPLLDLFEAENQQYDCDLFELGLKDYQWDDNYQWDQPPELPAEQLLIEPKETIDHTYLAMRSANASLKRTHNVSSSADESPAFCPPRKKRAVTLKKSRSLLRTIPAAPSTSKAPAAARKGRGRTVGRPDTPLSSGSDGEDDNNSTIAKVTRQYQPALNHCNVLVDHNYQTKAIKPDLLGVQTPSDSEDERLEGQQLSKKLVLPEYSVPDEEEIDVVSVNGLSSFTTGSATQVSNRSSRGRNSRHTSTVSTTTTRTGRETGTKRLPTNLTTQTKRGLEMRLGSLITTAHRNIHRRIMDDEQQQHLVADSIKEEDEEEEEQWLAPKSTRRRAPANRRSRGGDLEDKNKKRCMHNDMERMRRVDLKNSFDHLKVLVPSIANTSKCAKVTILKESKLCVSNLRSSHLKLDSKRAFLKTEQDIFRQRLSRLRNDLRNKLCNVFKVKA